MKIKFILLCVCALSLIAAVGFVHQAYADQAHQDVSKQVLPADVKKWDIELYGQKFTLIPDLYDAAEQEGGPLWEDVRHHVVKLLPDAFEGKYKLSREEILLGVERLRDSYNTLLYKDVRRMAEELVDSHPKFIIAGDKPGAGRYDDFKKLKGTEDKIDAMEFAIVEMFKSNTWREAVKDYQDGGDKALTQYYFANGYAFYEYAYALKYLSGMLRASPEMRDGRQ